MPRPLITDASVQLHASRPYLHSQQVSINSGEGSPSRYENPLSSKNGQPGLKMETLPHQEFLVPKLERSHRLPSVFRSINSPVASVKDPVNPLILEKTASRIVLNHLGINTTKNHNL